MFSYDSVELKPGGEEEEVNLDNVEEYIELVTDFCLSAGIHRQMEALRSKNIIVLTTVVCVSVYRDIFLKIVIFFFTKMVSTRFSLWRNCSHSVQMNYS